MKTFVSTMVLATGLLAASAQEQVNDPGHMTCRYNELFNAYCQKHGIDPKTDHTILQYEKEIRDYVLAHQDKIGERGATYVIPIVFHIVHTGGAENISDEQVKDGVRILNRDFQKMNADTAFVDPVFQSIIADVQFEFRLAQKDALGNCVSGITRTFSTSTNVGDWNMANEVYMNLTGGSSSSNILYPPDQYLNVFVCKDPQGAAGYTNYPMFGAMDPDHDAIWMRHDYLGTIGTSSEGRSRVLTHETGHWMNLPHVWGSNNDASTACGDDGVSDTPETRGWLTCNLTSNDVCNPGIRENVQNYMDYSYCCKMFTEGQKTRMHAAINSSVAGRSNLWQPANLIATGVSGPTVLCLADFNSDKKVICAGDSVHYSDVSYHGITSWNWNFASGTPASSVAQYPIVGYATPGQYSVDLVVGDGSSTGNVTKTNYVTVLDPVGAAVPFSEGFESLSTLPTAQWFIGNPDGQQTWEIVTTAAASGNKSMKLNNFDFNASGAREEFYSQTFDLSGEVDAQINFKYAYRQRLGSENEKLKVYISNNCGISWSLRKTLSGTDLSDGLAQGTPFTPTAAQWKKYEVDVTPGYFTQGFRFRIQFESDAGNNVFIDDINLDVNVGVNEIDRENMAFSVYPNPVSGTATVEYTLVDAAQVNVQLTDVTGRTIAVLERANKAPGAYRLNVDAHQVARGTYFVTIQAGNIRQARKVVVE